MELKNGYKVIYDKAANGEHTFYASKTGVFADAEEIVKLAAGEYKLIYEKDGSFYGSESGIPAEGDHLFVEFDRVFKEDEEEGTEEEPTPAAYTRRSRKAVDEEPVVSEPSSEDPIVEDPEE